MLLNSANNMANRAFHMSIRGCSATANNYGVRRCSTRHDVFLSAIGWSEYHLVMIKSSSQAYSSTTVSVSVSSITSQLHSSRFYRQSQLLLERRRHSTEFVTRKRLFSGTPSDTNDKDDGGVRGSDAKIDRSNFTKEVKIEMPKLDDNIKGVIEKWYKKEGDIIKKDEVICDIRTELFTFGMLTDDDYDSIMGVIHVPEGSDPIEHGTVICTTFNEGRDCEEETNDLDG